MDAIVEKSNTVLGVKDHKRAEIEARRAIEDNCEVVVHDANVILQTNCPNVDLVVFAYDAPVYVQVKSSTKPAGKDCVVVNGSPWTTKELYEGKSIFNSHDHYKAKFVVLVERHREEGTVFYVAQAEALDRMARERALSFMGRPKKDGSQRSIKFRKELPRELLKP